MADQSSRNARPLKEAMREVRLALQAENYAAKTRSDYVEKWTPFCIFLGGHLEREPTVGDFTLANARAYIAVRLAPEDGRRPLAPVSARTHVSTLRAISARFAAEGLTGEHRLQALAPPRLDREPVARVLTDVERADLFAGARGVSPTARRNLGLLGILDDVGPRVSELVALNREDVDLERRRIVLDDPAKRGELRILPMGTTTIRILRDLIGTRRTKGPLFVQRGGARMTDDAVRAVLVRLSERTGVERVSPHDFRHTASTNYTAAGASQALKNKVFGWTPDRRSMDERYTHLTPEQVIEAHQRLSPLDRLAPFRRNRAA